MTRHKPIDPPSTDDEAHAKTRAAVIREEELRPDRSAKAKPEGRIKADAANAGAKAAIPTRST